MLWTTAANCTTRLRNNTAKQKTKYQSKTIQNNMTRCGIQNERMCAYRHALELMTAEKRQRAAQNIDKNIEIYHICLCIVIEISMAQIVSVCV